VGSRALMSLRLEKGYGSWGRDYSPEYWPQESGLAGLVRADKDFLNRKAWERIRHAAPREVLCLLEIEATNADASGGEPIFLQDGTPAGQVTSGDYGHTVGKSLALGYVKDGLAGPGDLVQVALLGRPHAARILDAPPFDPDGLRLRGTTSQTEPAR
jgi:dimethylglycine dehydrogenase